MFGYAVIRRVRSKLNFSRIEVFCFAASEDRLYLKSEGERGELIERIMFFMEVKKYVRAKTGERCKIL